MEQIPQITFQLLPLILHKSLLVFQSLVIYRNVYTRTIVRIKINHCHAYN